MLLTVASRAESSSRRRLRRSVKPADGLDGLLLRLLPETLVLHEHVVDGVEQRLLLPGGQMHPVSDPLMEIRTGFRRVAVNVEAFAHSHRERPAAITARGASKGVPSSTLCRLDRLSRSRLTQNLSTLDGRKDRLMGIPKVAAPPVPPNGEATRRGRGQVF